MSWRMGEVYAAVTDRILINLARHFQYIKEGSAPGSAWDYQLRKLAELGQVTRETEAIIIDSMEGGDAALASLLEETIRESLKPVEKPLRKAAEKGLLLGEGFLPPEVSPQMTQTFQAYYRQAADRMNLVNTVMLESTQEAYRSTVADIALRMERTQGILNVAAGEVITGVSPLNKAIRDGVRKMVDNGITGFVDHGGHHWSPEAYITMDIRTTLANTGRAAVTEEMQRYGCDTFSVSWHDGARPLCYPWQGKVISESGWTGEVEDLDGNKVHVYALTETSYGEPAGLFGINCGHYKIPFIPGFSKARQPEQTEEQNDREYRESQEQRALERKLREEKRDLQVLKAQGAMQDEIKEQRQKVENAKNNLDQFCNETGRARRVSREQTPNINSLNKLNEKDIIRIDDTVIRRSLGARAANYDIRDASGQIYHYMEGTRVQNSEVFAGYGTRNPLREEVKEGLSKQYGGDPEKWQHAKGFGVIDDNGEGVKAEIHWFQQKATGQVGHKIKRWLE